MYQYKQTPRQYLNFEMSPWGICSTIDAYSFDMC